MARERRPHAPRRPGLRRVRALSAGRVLAAMSGIAGAIRLDGARAAAGAIDAMVEILRHRGGDDHAVWSDEIAAFGHAMLHTTAESRNEPQPLVDAQLAIVADVRLDNRAELLSLLNIRGESIGDAALILAAY